LLIPLICSWGPRYQHQTIAAVFSVDCVTIRSVLLEQLSNPCHLQSVHGLVSSDNPPRANFCQWFVQQTTIPFFVSSVRFTDEVTYSRDGITNFHNQHQRAGENPCGTIHDRHQLQVRISVWLFGRFTYFARMCYRECWQGFPLKWSSTSAGKCTCGSWSMVCMTGLQHVLADLFKMCSIMPIMTNGWVEQD